MFGLTGRICDYYVVVVGTHVLLHPVERPIPTLLNVVTIVVYLLPPAVVDAELYQLVVLAIGYFEYIILAVIVR